MKTALLTNPLFDPTPRFTRLVARKRARRKPDSRQRQFEFMAEEERPPRLALRDMTIESCKALWYAVLKAGIEGYIRDRDRGQDEDDKHWVIYDAPGEMRERVGGFRWICHQLGMDADILRERLVRC